MFLLPALAAVGASFGWATGIVLAQAPARQLGAFEFTRIQLIACAAILGVLTTGLGFWESVDWHFAGSFAASSGIGILLGNLAMIECLRRGGPRRTEILLSLKAPMVTGMAFLWLGETLTITDLVGGALAMAGVILAIFFGSNTRSGSDALHGSMASILLLGCLAAGFQGFGFLVMKPAMLAGSEPLAVSAVRLLFAAFALSLFALWPAAAFRSSSDVTPGLLGRTILPGFIGYGISSSLLLYAFANFDAGIAAVLGSLSPILVLPILWVREGQSPRLPAIAGAVLAVTGIAVILVL